MVSRINCATTISRSLGKTVGVLQVISLAESHTQFPPSANLCFLRAMVPVKQTRQTSLGIKTLTKED